MSFDPDAQVIASTSFDGTVRLWQLAAEKIFTVLQDQNEEITSLSFSADGQTLASSTQAGNIMLWDFEGGVPKKLEGHTDSVNSVAFSPDSETLISASNDKMVKVWTRDGHLEATLKGHEAKVKSVAVSSNGEFWASVSENGALKLWSSTGEVLQELTLEEGFADIVRFHPSKPLIAVAVGRDTERNVVLWDWQQNTLTPLASVGEFAVKDVQFNSSGDSLVL